MTITINLETEKRPLGELVEQTQGGTEIVFTRNDRPVAKLVAIPVRTSRHFGSARGLIEIGEDFDEPLEDFRDLRTCHEITSPAEGGGLPLPRSGGGLGRGSSPP